MAAAHRLKLVHKALSGRAVPVDVVIASACRTPICRAKRGGLKDTDPTDLLAVVLKAVVERVGLPAATVEDVIVGNTLLPGAGAFQARMAMLLAGYPQETAVHTVNRQCASGLQAIASVAAAIAAGHYDVGVAAGLESMSFGSMNADYGPISQAALEHPKARQCTIPMGTTSETVARRYGVGREEQDRFALASQERALAAQKAGKFDAEIVPVETTVVNEKGDRLPVTVSRDDGPRPTTYESLAKLKPSFAADGHSTAGNSSQVSDGAAAVLLMRHETAERLGLRVLAHVRSFAVAGCGPDEMGIGPVFAIPKALERAGGLTVGDIDVFEVNEAFASQCLYSAKTLGIPLDRLNPLGGAIALGHPLGSTGCRQTVTLLHELRRRGGGKGVVSMCVGTGMGAAAVFETPH